jgi:hypothetical protein
MAISIPEETVENFKQSKRRTVTQKAEVPPIKMSVLDLNTTLKTEAVGNQIRVN